MATRSFTLLLLGAQSVPLASAGFSWPHSLPSLPHSLPSLPHSLPSLPSWAGGKTTTTTTTSPTPAAAIHDFELGVAAALGLNEMDACFNESKASVGDIYDAGQLYLKGGWSNKVKALYEFGVFTKDAIVALENCDQAMTKGEEYKKLAHNLLDKRYYSMTNALTLGLNTAEDRKMLVTFKHAWQEKHYYAAGLQLMQTILDVLEHPGIPEDGTAAVLFAEGLAEGYTGELPLKCIKDAKVEFGAIMGGVTRVASVIGAVGGLESLFHGLAGVVPMYKDCAAELPKMKALFNQVADYRHPGALAKSLWHNMKSSGIDITLEVASAVLDVKGHLWRRLGEDVGRILARITLPAEEPSLLVV